MTLFINDDALIVPWTRNERPLYRGPFISLLFLLVPSVYVVSHRGPFCYANVLWLATQVFSLCRHQYATKLRCYFSFLSQCLVRITRCSVINLLRFSLLFIVFYRWQYNSRYVIEYRGTHWLRPSKIYALSHVARATDFRIFVRCHSFSSNLIYISHL